ncbi:MAG: flippase-like domain-containing protein [Candidatus Omnitrophica bacterium]|nr:flippase-like domain-containing protein [Candidatus Omnitrophota bacterium]
MKRALLVLAKIIISVGLLALLIWLVRKDIPEIVPAISSCDLKYLSAAVLIFVFNVAAMAYRLKIVFEGESLSMTFLECLQLTYMGYFFNNFMPTSVGGDLVKGHLSVKDKADRIRAYASVMMDRLIGLYSFLILAAGALIYKREMPGLKYVSEIILIMLSGGAIMFWIVIHEKIALLVERFFSRIKLGGLGEKLKSVYDIVHDYRKRMDVVVKSLLISFVSQGMYFVTIYFFFLALGASSVRLLDICLVVPVVSFISMLPSIGGLGVREGAMVAFFGPLVGKQTAFAVSILLLLGLFVVSIIGGAIYFYWSVFRKK